MRYYIDTNTLVFYIHVALDNNALQIIDDYYNKIYISSIAVAEFIHLIQCNRIKVQIKASDAIDFIQNELGFEIKPTTTSHLNTFANLPTVAEHNDPNDRLIIAQAITERIPILSTDTKFPLYQKYGLQLTKVKHY